MQKAHNACVMQALVWVQKDRSAYGLQRAWEQERQVARNACAMLRVQDWVVMTVAHSACVTRQVLALGLVWVQEDHNAYDWLRARVMERVARSACVMQQVLEALAVRNAYCLMRGRVVQTVHSACYSPPAARYFPSQ